MYHNPPYNQLFLENLQQLEKMSHATKTDPYRKIAYTNARNAILSHKKDINSLEDLDKVKSVGPGIIAKFKELLHEGEIQVLKKNKESETLIEIFTKIYGVGPMGAKKIINSGIKTIDDLRKSEDEFLNDTQKLGLKYYEDINKRIPRSEIDEYKKEFDDVFNQAKNETGQKTATFEIVGSYRRGAETSGDIDVIVTNEEDNKEVFARFIELLVNKKIILHKLTDGVKQIKILVISRLPGKPARRVDFMYSPSHEFPFALLYFTGSQLFNTAMRQWALDRNYTMNEHRIENTGTKKSIENIKNEKDIFKFLKLNYVEPKDRIDKDSLSPQIKKPMLIIVPSFVDLFRKGGVAYLETLSEKDLTNIIRKSNDAYHTKGTPFFSDNEYDVIKEFVEAKYPDAEVLSDIGAELIKHKVSLPYEMASMDKIKPTSNAMDLWLNKYNDPSKYVVSVKLDGVSGLYDGSTKKLYTRGNGKIGQDVSYLIPYFDFPEGDFVIRGEFVIKKENFKTFVNKANARNLVAGMINSKTINPGEMELVDFVAYEVIKPVLKPSAQFEYLKNEIKYKNVCQYTIMATLSNTILSDLLLVWRNHSEYDMDGIVVGHDKIYERLSGNPKHAFAFKMVLKDQTAEAKVVNVLWNASKDGYLKPRVQIEPIVLDGVTITYATGFNAAFIEKNNINVGSVVELIRSGDVIPYIRNVVQPSKTPHFPDVEYKWNDTHVDIMLVSKEDNVDVLRKTITGFFSDVEGLGPGNISKIVAAGFDTIPKIIAMDVEDYLTISGFKEKTANKLHNNIKAKIDNMSVVDLMVGSNIFGRGFGEKRIDSILEEYPDILTSELSSEEKLQKLIKIKGFAKKTAQLFVLKIPDFINFIDGANLHHKLVFKKKVVANKGHVLYNKSVVFTGGRDKNLENEIIGVGGNIEDKVKTDTFVLVTLSLDSSSSKMKDAEKHNVKIMLISDFKEAYFK